MAEVDLVALARNLDVVRNAHDEETVLRFFTEDVFVQIEPPLSGESEAYAGEENLGSFV